MNEIESAIEHYKTGISHDIFSEPVLGYARLAVEALEQMKQGKQNPKEVVNQGIDCKSGNWIIICPDCDTSIESPRKMAKYCPNCGQALKFD